EIRYSLDGREPDSLNSPVFDKPITINRNQRLLVKAFKEGWVSSPTVERRYVQSGKVPDRVVLEARPHYLYQAQQERTFFDLESGGDAGGNHADGKWQGYFQSPMSVGLHFDNPTVVDTLSLSVLQNYVEAHMMPIYAPEYVEVWGGTDSTHVRLLARVLPHPDKFEQLQKRRLIHCPLGAFNLRYLRIVAEPYQKVPEGFPAAGAEGWMFVDELVLK
ncbi:MAG TPA: chitobiase/beta-hexosaminidase C-terminal domain-containing protein, partial [Sphingobacterium sp.]|nr:chitobiase/beta-hexosaminidase C-terminal domain-containing protein [Sphingobacterium sp.]